MISQLSILRPGVGVLIPTGEQIELAPGDTLRIEVSFKYRTPRTASCNIAGYIGVITKPVASKAVDVSLVPSADFITKTVTIDILIPTSGVAGGVYNLGVYIKDTDLGEEIANCITIVGPLAGFDLMGMMGMMMVVMMMSMIMPMMEEVE